MTINASMVKELRDRSGAGMMECKRALVETDGNIEKAIEHLRKTGAAKAAKKAGRIAAEGKIIVVSDKDLTVMVEINSETDFVAKDSNFLKFCELVGETIMEQAPDSPESLLACTCSDGKAIEDKRLELISVVGENIGIRRFVTEQTVGSAVLDSYLHGDRIGVLVTMEGGEPELSRGIAMHIAASSPVCIDDDQIPASVIEGETAIFQAQAEESGKPQNIIEKMVEGRIRKYKAEITLMGQPYVRSPDQTVGELLASKSARVRKFTRYELGEGIEKKEENFAEEVMAQAKAAGET
ncbi:MAG: translation elongation factor Ts [Gammaproteobacteria bacterium]|jgi:elongation factor Ts|tara:strand:- start:208 stop:1095 length:888 start_codon:yes stop_codon:yes gene_type:complete